MEIASDGVCRLNIMYPDTSFLIPFSDKLGHYLRLERSVFSASPFIPTLSGSLGSISVHLHLQGGALGHCDEFSFFFTGERKGLERKSRKKPDALLRED